ncbi:hypothetical protein EV359DRAFT_76643 [Lentinula novae-zelandiae]|nr:hypothetical protein EV359DRAFT_76643 [Lentinula novae-zelandiae]
MKAISVSTFAIAAVAMMTVVPVTALPTAISLATNASPTLPVVDGTVSFGAPAHASQTDLPTPTPTGVVRLDAQGNTYIRHSWNSAKKDHSPGKQQKEAEPNAEPKTPAQKKTEEANAIFGPENPLNHLYSFNSPVLNSTRLLLTLMPDDAGGDCVSIFCGCCCVGIMSALSSWCDTIAPYSCCRYCRSNSVPSTFDEQVRRDMEKSKAEDAAKKQKQMEPTPNMNVSKPLE